MRKWFFLLFLGFLACTAAGEENALDQELLARLTGEGCEALAQLEEYFFKERHIQWNRTATDNRPLYQANYFPSKGGGFLIIHQKLDGESMYLCNSDYFSVISRTPDQSTWTLEKCVRTEDLDPEEFPLLSDYYCVLPAYLFRSRSLARMILGREIEITEIRELTDSSEEAITFDFVRGQNCPSTDDLLSGSVTLLPKKSWAISSAELEFKDEGGTYHEKKVFEFQEDFPVYPFFDLKKTTLVLNHLTTGDSLIWTFDITGSDFQSYSEEDEEELRLPFYGLPEPDFVRPAPRPRLLFSVVGSVIIIIAVALFVIKRRS